MTSGIVKFFVNFLRTTGAGLLAPHRAVLIEDVIDPLDDVDVDHNSQLSLYALGGLHAYGYIYPIETIRMSIVQPQLDNVNTFECSQEELEAYGTGSVPDRNGGRHYKDHRP